MSGPIKRALLSDSVYEALHNAILLGDLKPGERLRELDLAHKFGTSQAPVREALRKLEQVGLVKSIAHRGTFVAGLTKDELSDIMTLRAVLEGMALRRALSQITDNDIGYFAALYLEMREAAQRKDIAALVETDIRFHTATFELAGSEFLHAVWSVINSKARLAIAMADRFYQHDLLDIADIHAPIVAAIKSRDAEAAVEANTKHLQWVFERIEIDFMLRISGDQYEKAVHGLEQESDNLAP